MSEVSTKKARIVSNDNNVESGLNNEDQHNNVITKELTGTDLSLQDLIEAEFNSRLSNLEETDTPDCMTSSPVEKTSENNELQYTKIQPISQTIEENVEMTLPTKQNSSFQIPNDVLDDANDTKIATFNFIEHEKSVCENVNMDIQKSDVTKEDIYLESQPKTIDHSAHVPDFFSQKIEVISPTDSEGNVDFFNEQIEILSSENSDETDLVVKKTTSIKDKLMSGSDEKMATIFSQTITSPVATPTDETFDILQAIKREDSSIEEFERNENILKNESLDNSKTDIIEVQNGVLENGQCQQVVKESLPDIIDFHNGIHIQNGVEHKDVEIKYQYEVNIKNDSAVIEKEGEVNVGDIFCATIDSGEMPVGNGLKLNEDAEWIQTVEVQNGVDKQYNVYITHESVELEYSNGEISPENERQFSQESETVEEIHLPDAEIQNDIIEKTDFDASNQIEICDENVAQVAGGDTVVEVNDDDDYKLSENTFLLNDKKVHENDAVTNSAKLVMSLQTSTTTMETTTVTEKIETKTNTAEKKKKKSKKSKKDNEKENISVTDHIEDDLSQVNVKNLKKNFCQQSNNFSNNVRKSEPVIRTGISIKELCRSFGDLTSINDDNSTNLMQRSPVSPQKSPNSRAKSMIDLRRLDQEFHLPLYTGVSVKALRDSFMNLANLKDDAKRDTWRLCRSESRHLQLYRTRSLSTPGSKSSFSKFDALQKKTVLHVRSSDAGKAQEKFNGSAQMEQICKACSKQVFVMEQIKAEKAIWHKNCFRCKECSKQLNVDSYESNEGELYCKPHFKALFAPKVVEDTQPQKPRKHEMIIRESQPIELPPDVVRASDKPDLGLEELQSLNVKSRFQVFEQHKDDQNDLERTPSNVNVKRSASILSKLAKFQAKGMDIGVTDDSLNGIPVEFSSEESEESDDDIEGDDADLIRAKRKTAHKEQPVVFDKLNDLKSMWETGQTTKEERREEHKQEIQNIRSRLFMGKQGKMKELYQQAVMESESGANVKKLVATEVCDKQKSIKEKFERGEPLEKDEKIMFMEDDRGVFDAATSKKSRSLFLELDANAGKTVPAIKPVSPKIYVDIKKTRELLARQASEDVVRSSDTVEDVRIKTADVSNKFKFFETYEAPKVEKKKFRITPPRDGVVKSGSPEREIYRDPEVVRALEPVEDDSVIAEKSHTASKMLSIFRQMEEQRTQEPATAGPKPLKRFTPPPDAQQDESESEEADITDSESEEASESEQETGGDIVRAADKPTDEYLIAAQNAARAKQLRAKFEKWETNEIKREQNNSSINLSEECAEEQIESAKSLRARFESMRETNNQRNDRQPRAKVNRFVEYQKKNAELCDTCEKRVYPLEKVECNGKYYHKQCFRCLQCNTILRMDSYTLNQGMLYCIPHFKQLFITKGNYETGFGFDQHKAKWEQQQQQQPAH